MLVELLKKLVRAYIIFASEIEEKTMNCNMCPHECNIDRNVRAGRCKAMYLPTVSLASLHKFEEPCISGINGSGTVFFSGCNLNCVYCQNKDISQKIQGKEVTIGRLADIFIEQQGRGATNINLVTPTIYASQIKQAVIIAKKNGLTIPIVYNSSGYDKVETLKELEGIIDIYLPDFKYISNELGEKYSKIKNYTDVAINAIKEMKRQVGVPKFNSRGEMLSGLIIRHMILPNNLENTKGILDCIAENFGIDTYISVMAQYFPTNEVSANSYYEINRKVTQEELSEVEEYIFKLGFENGFIQELGNHEEEYVPNFNMENV